MRVDFYNTIQTDSWIICLLPSIEISNISYCNDKKYKYTISLAWLNFNIGISI